MSSKFQAVLSAVITGIAGFLSWLATVPPEQQSGMLAQLVEIIPLHWRPAVGVWMRLLTFAAGIYATHKASQSGPQTPPKNPPQ